MKKFSEYTHIISINHGYIFGYILSIHIIVIATLHHYNIINNFTHILITSFIILIIISFLEYYHFKFRIINAEKKNKESWISAQILIKNHIYFNCYKNRIVKALKIAFLPIIFYPLFFFLLNNDNLNFLNAIHLLYILMYECLVYFIFLHLTKLTSSYFLLKNNTIIAPSDLKNLYQLHDQNNYLTSLYYQINVSSFKNLRISSNIPSKDHKVNIYPQASRHNPTTPQPPNFSCNNFIRKSSGLAFKGPYLQLSKKQIQIFKDIIALSKEIEQNIPAMKLTKVQDNAIRKNQKKILDIIDNHLDIYMTIPFKQRKIYNPILQCTPELWIDLELNHQLKSLEELYLLFFKEKIQDFIDHQNYIFKQLEHKDKSFQTFKAD